MATLEMHPELGREVPVGSIDKELRKLWAEDEARTNASLMNLAVYSEEPGALEKNSAAVRELTAEHACRAILIGMCVFPLTSAAMALQAPFWLLAGFLVIDGFSGMLWNLAQVSYRQRHIPAPLLGRVNSAFRFLGTGPAAFGAFTFGALIAWAEPLGTVEAVLVPYAVAAVIGGALAVYAAICLRLEA